MGKIRHTPKVERAKYAAEQAQKEALLQATLQNKTQKKQNVAILFGELEKVYAFSETKNSEESKANAAYTGTNANLIAALAKTLKGKSKKHIFDTFKALILHLERKKCQKILNNADNVEAIYCMAYFTNRFVRKVEDWKPQSHNTEKQFSSFAKHLFAVYEIPNFLESAWLYKEKNLMENGVLAADWTFKQWYVALASGSSVRSLTGLPPNFTKRMMHEFLQAPDYMTVAEALRYGQVMGFGGDERLAWYINRTLLGRNNFAEDEFWQTVVQFFAKTQMFDYEQIGAVIDYIQVQKFGRNYANAEGNNNYRRLIEAPEQPNFVMKGRTAENLLRQTLAWHNVLAKTRGKSFQWKKSAIQDFIFTEGTMYDEQVYCFTELLSTVALFEEGKAMSHCVASYDHACVNGRTAIFSLTLREGENKPLRLVTIEVQLENRQIVQVRGKYNASPTTKTMNLVQRWALMEKLSVSKWL
jgi:hypothetical protein